jgi:hypothetical protein
MYVVFLLWDGGADLKLRLKRVKTPTRKTDVWATRQEKNNLGWGYNRGGA